MVPKSAKPTSDELLAQFDNLDVEESSKDSKPTVAAEAKAEHEDVLAEMENLAAQRPGSGPGTPRLSSDRPRSSARSPRPSATIERPNEEKAGARPSEEAGRSSRSAKPEQSKPETEEAAQHDEEQGGGWWGGLTTGLFATATATASAAMKQAEAAVKEIQNNEEAQRWAEQVKGNVGVLRAYGKLHPYFQAGTPICSPRS